MRLVQDRQAAEEALRKSEEKFDKAFRSIPDAMLISTLAEGSILEVNESFERQFGYSREEVLGRTGVELKLWVEPEDRAMMTRLLRERGMVRNLEFELTRKSGEKRLTLLSGEVIDLEGQSCFLMVLRDITERKQLEEKLRRARRFESIATLTSAVARDLNNDLIPIQTTLRKLREAPIEDRYEPLLSRLEQHARHGMDMVRQILTFAGGGERLETPPPELPAGRGECVLVVDDDVSICDIIRETLEAFGYRVLSAHNGAEAVQLYAERREEIDVVVIDMIMPVMDGESALRELRALNPAVSVIAVNGLTTPENAGRYDDVRILLEKPYTAEMLLTSLQDALTTPS